jgi:sec-independent protein translocase protein TatB
MFDIAFSELLLIAIVALIVIGPQRLPKVARTLGHLFGRMQRYVNDVKTDISREMELDELRKIQSSMEDTARSMRDSVTQGMSEAESELGKVAESVQSDSEPATAPFSAQPPAPASAQGELPLETDPPAVHKQAQEHG